MTNLNLRIWLVILFLYPSLSTLSIPELFTLALLLTAVATAVNAGTPKPVAAKITPATGGTITATNSEVITATPEGTLIDPLYSVSEASYFMYSSALVTLATNGYAGAMVRTDEAIYIRNIISEYNAPQTYWVKGDIEADGSVTFRFPQLIYHNASNPAADRYVALMTPQSNGTGISLQTVEGDCD